MGKEKIPTAIDGSILNFDNLDDLIRFCQGPDYHRPPL